MESIESKQVQLLDAEPRIIFDNIMASFLTDESNIQYQLRAIDIIKLKSQLFCNETVIQHLLDLLEWSVQSEGIIPSWKNFIDYIDPTKYKYVSSRIFPMMLKQLYQMETGSREKMDVLRVFQDIGATVGMNSREDWKDWSYISIYLPSIMKQLLLCFNQLKPSQRGHFLNLSYFRHLVDHVCKLDTVDMMCGMIQATVAKEGVSSPNSQLLFDRFIKIVMDPPSTSSMKNQSWYSRMNAMAEMIGVIQGGIWTNHQIQVFTKRDNEYFQKLKKISSKQYKKSYKRSENLKRALFDWMQNHFVLCLLFISPNPKTIINNQEMQTLLLEMARTSLDEFITMAPIFENAYCYFIPTIVLRWQLLLLLYIEQQDKVKVVLDYYQKIVPLLLVNNIPDESQYIGDDYQYMTGSFWLIIKILVKNMDQQQCQIHLNKIHQMMIDFNDERQSQLPNHFCLLLETLWRVQEYDDYDDDDERLCHQFITKVDDRYLLKQIN
ncbi:hypothetical protein DFA_00324 [Cavenderia fasciculata]|uniref:Uncharacterized protein n=1 Tax=Cavenderia fasciculata TaxID=261658 RepID=F4PY86_CACFS|nr:uncharacterized protein DFA_00324 [Cavenderia fasciculata]EGG19746.1 hypothetical protein DFA_00324 [Cavenderia fasciculata]|eukprot:XP_004358040.1 hypothetical protein DFA_00324 [Cavenderia fasciculata]